MQRTFTSLWIAAALVAWEAQAKMPSAQQCGSTGAQEQLYGEDYGSSSMDLETFQTLANSNDVKSVSALLSRFPESYRRNHAALFRSRSNQPASYTNPRVVFYGENATFLSAVHGETQRDSQGEYRTMEVAGQDPVTRQWTFQKVTERNGTLTLSEPNPAECLACHGSPPHPIWDPYPVWSGAYLGVNGNPENPEETTGMASFVSRLQNDPGIYGQVPQFRTASSTESLRYLRTTNSALSALLADNHLRRIKLDLIRLGQYERLKFAVIAAVNSCANLEEFVPPTPEGRTLASFQEEVERVVNEPQYATYHLRDRTTYANSPKKVYPQVVGIQYLFHPIGLDVRDYALTLERDAYAFMTPKSGLADLQCGWLADPQIREMAERGLVDGEPLCSALLEAHRQRASEGTAPAAHQTTPSH